MTPDFCDLVHASFFTGIGGFDLGALMAGIRTEFQVERDEFCLSKLNKNFPNVTKYKDIRDFIKHDAAKYRGTIDIISGGFPCQGFSVAGRRLGTADDRYLWPEMLAGIDIIRPAWVIAENVTGILSMEDESGVLRSVFPTVENRTITRYDTVDIFEGIYTRQAEMLVERICQDLEKIGYQVAPFVVPAASIGAPHRRDRVWLIANAEGVEIGAGLRAGEPRRKRRAGLGNIRRQRDVTDAGKVGRETGNEEPNAANRGQGGQRQNGTTERLGVVGDATDADNSKLGRTNEAGNFQDPTETTEGTTRQQHRERLRPGLGYVLEDATDAVGKRRDRRENVEGKEQAERSRAPRNGSANDADTDGARCKEQYTAAVANYPGFNAGVFVEHWSKWTAEPGVCGMDDGIPERLDRIAALGNAIAPHVAFAYFDTIKKIELGSIK